MMHDKLQRTTLTACSLPAHYKPISQAPTAPCPMPPTTVRLPLLRPAPKAWPRGRAGQPLELTD